MHSILKMTWVDTKLFLRNPVTTLFTLGLPLFMLLAFGWMYGNQPDPAYGGYGSVDVSVPGYIAVIIGIAGLRDLLIEVAMRREQGILRRFRATPLQPAVVLSSQVIVNLSITGLGVILLILAGSVFFGMHLPIDPLAVALAFVVSSLSFFALSFAIAALISKVSTARAVGMAVLINMMFLSGTALPRGVMPASLQQMSRFMPLTYVINLVSDVWFGRGWNVSALIVLSGLLIGCVLISIRTFRWE